jgi:long-chain acyl-CoA synthetase
MNVCDYLLGGKPPDATALLTLQGGYSYGELRAAVTKLATSLSASDLSKGERIVLLAEDGLFWIAAYLGILRAGLVCVPLPPKILKEDLEYIFGLTKPARIFASSRNFPALLDLVPAEAVVTETVLTSDSETPEPVTSAETTPDDLAAVMFTSGSTGKPRGVMVSHGNIMANTDSIIEYLGLTSSDRIMAVLPFHYCFGTSLLHTHLRVGGSVVIDPRFMYPDVVLNRMGETECTGFAGVPSHFQILLRKSRLSRMELPHLRYVQQAGGQLAPTFITELRKALPGKQIFVMYGQTEATARLSYLSPELLDLKLGSVGKGIPGVQLKVLKDDGQPVAPGETGEIVAEGANIARGYWNDPDESTRCFQGGKLHTGDLATVDEDGFIYIVDRANDFLKCGGKRVSCRQLENALLDHPALLEVAVVGEPDEVLGEAAVAYVVPRDVRDNPSSEQLAVHCKEKLPRPFVPKRFVFLRCLPKNSSGKVLKAQLKKSTRLAAIQ